MDRERRIVQIPPYVVEEAVRSAPASLCLAGRRPRNDFVLEADRVGFTNFGEGVRIVDPHTGELREPTKQDVGDSANLATPSTTSTCTSGPSAPPTCRSRSASCTTPRRG